VASGLSVSTLPFSLVVDHGEAVNLNLLQATIVNLFFLYKMPSLLLTQEADTCSFTIQYIYTVLVFKSSTGFFACC
jgi:hypothetical protein